MIIPLVYAHGNYMQLKKKKKTIWQVHHLEYDPPVTVRIRKGEHRIITWIQRYNALSSGAKRAIRYEINKKSTYKGG